MKSGGSRKAMMKALLSELESEDKMDELKEKLLVRHGKEVLDQMRTELMDRHRDVLLVAERLVVEKANDMVQALSETPAVLEYCPDSVGQYLIGYLRTSMLSCLDGLEEMYNERKAEQKEEAKQEAEASKAGNKKPDGEIEH